MWKARISTPTKTKWFSFPSATCKADAAVNAAIIIQNNWRKAWALEELVFDEGKHA